MKNPQPRSDVGQQPPQPWGSQQQQPQHQHVQASPSLSTLQASMPAMQPLSMPSMPSIPSIPSMPSSMPSPSPIPTMNALQSTPRSTPPTFANPPSPWFSAQHQYQQHITARRNDQMDFRPYGQQSPQAPGHHPAPGQPPLSVPPPHGQQQPHGPHSTAQTQPQHPQQHPQPPQPASQHAPQQQQQQQPQQPPAPQQPSANAAAPAPGSTPVAQRSRKRPNPATTQTPATSASPIIPPPIPTASSSTGTTSVIPPPSTPAAAGTAGTPASSATPSAAAGNKAIKSQPDESGANPTPPPAKKSRTNTPWTPAEEHRLKQMRDAGSSWAEIAKTFPTRTEGSVKKHWYKDMHYAEFAEDESVALLNAIREYETQKWKVIGQKVGKPAKACEQYAKEHFSSDVTMGTGKK